MKNVKKEGNDFSREIIGIIDIGTSACKTTFFNLNGKEVVSAKKGYSIRYLPQNCVEQNPELWYQATIYTLKQCIKKLRENYKIRGLSFTGQMHGIVPVDRNGKAIYNCITLQDRRSQKEYNKILKKVSRERIHKITGGVPDPSMPVFKILWLRENRPSIFKKTYKFLSPKDYVRNRITRTFITDPIDASGTLLYDIHKSCWSKEILKLINLEEDLLPKIRSSNSIDGFSDEEFRQRTSVEEGTPIIVGAGDDVDIIGVGAIDSGDAIEHIGSTGTIAVVTDKPITDPKCRIECYPHPIKNKWCVGAPTQAAGAALQWFKNTFYSEFADAQRSDKEVYNLIIKLAARVPIGAEGLIFLPFLAGERAPLWNFNAKACFYGMAFKHKREHFARAVLEGVAFSLKSIMDIIEELGQKINRIFCSGGGASNEIWRQIRSEIYGKKIVTTNAREGASFGTFVLALVGLKVYNSVEKAIHKLVVKEEETLPTSKSKHYVRFYEMYKQLVGNLKPMWQ